jgi:hypothetical protein
LPLPWELSLITSPISKATQIAGIKIRRKI